MKCKVLELRPTQIAVGMKEVESRVQKIRNLKSRELEDYLKDRLVPVVLGPRKLVYIVDRHHHVRACWEAGVGHVHAEMKADLSKHDSAGFWKAMGLAKWLHLYDQFGGGPHDPIQLPENVRGLADDPYRSLAWTVRHEGGYKKAEVPFSDFAWADFFRKRLKAQLVFERYEEAVHEALKLARSPQAAHLPGRNHLSPPRKRGSRT